MAIPIITNLDGGASVQLQNMLLHILTSDPGSPVQGQFWFNSGSKVARFHDGTATQTLAMLSTRLDQFAAPTSALAMNGNKITGLATPTASGDAATWDWVNSVVNGYDWKQSVAAASTGAIAFSGSAPDTLDGVTLAVGSRVLLKAQTGGVDNGIYVVSSLGTGADGTWVRASDASSSAMVTTGMTVFVDGGTANGSTSWSLVTASPTLGTTALVFTQTSGQGSYTGSNLGTGTVIYAGSSGNQFQFNSLASGNTAIGLALAAGTITATFAPGNVDKNALGGSVLSVANGGTGSATQNFADLSTTQTIGGAKTFSSTITGNVSGTAANVTGTVAVANGGTGQTTVQAAINSLVGGAGSSGQVLRSNGTNVVMAALASTDLPATIAADTTGTAANVTGTVAVANGGTGAVTAPLARAALSAAVLGANSDITSLSGLTTALTVGQGGTGATTLTGFVYGNGAGAFTASTTIAGSAISGNISGTAANVTGTVAITNGGTGQTTRQLGLNAIAGAVTSGLVMRGDGTNVGMGSLLSSDLPATIAANTSGTAAGLSATLAVASGGTGATTAPLARAALSAAVLGANSDITSLSGLTTALTVAQGGTGAATAAGSKTNLGFMGRYAVNNTAGASSTVNHLLNTTDITVSVWELSGSKRMVMCEVDITDANHIVVYTANSPSAGAYRIVVMG